MSLITWTTNRILTFKSVDQTIWALYCGLPIAEKLSLKICSCQTIQAVTAWWNPPVPFSVNPQKIAPTKLFIDWLINCNGNSHGSLGQWIRTYSWIIHKKVFIIVPKFGQIKKYPDIWSDPLTAESPFGTPATEVSSSLLNAVECCSYNVNARCYAPKNIEYSVLGQKYTSKDILTHFLPHGLIAVILLREQFNMFTVWLL